MAGAATYPDGYDTQEPAWSCSWDGCPFASDDLAEIERHEDTAHEPDDLYLYGPGSTFANGG